MELTEKQKAAFQELAEWAARHDAEIELDGWGCCGMRVAFNDAKFALRRCSVGSVSVWQGLDDGKWSFKAKQQEGGK